MTRLLHHVSNSGAWKNQRWRKEFVLMKTYRNSYEILDRALYLSETAACLLFVAFAPIAFVSAFVCEYLESPMLWVIIVSVHVGIFILLTAMSSMLKWRRDVVAKKMESEQ